MNLTNSTLRAFRVLPGLTLALGAFSLVTGAQAASTYTFTNTASGTYAWSTAANWLGGLPVSATDAAVAIFGDTTTPLTGSGAFTINSDPVSLTLHTLTLNGLAPAYPLTGNGNVTLTIGTAGNAWTFDGTVPTVNLNSRNNSTYQFNSPGITIQPNLTLNQNVIFAGNGNASGFFFSGVISDGGAGKGITKTGSAAMTLNGSAVNTFTGGLTLNAGTLTEDFSNLATPTDLVNNANVLTLGGGTLGLKGRNGAATSQTFASTTLNSGGSVLTLSQNSATSLTAALGTLTRNAGGILNFSVAPNASTVIATTSTGNDTSGILGPWASVGTGTSLQYATTSSGNILSYTGATPDAGNLASVTSATGNYTYSAAAAVSGNPTGNTLRYTGAATTTTINSPSSLTLNGLMNAGTGTLTLSGTGKLVIGANKELVVHGSGQGITINTPITDNGAGGSLVYYNSSSSSQLYIKTANNTYSGGTTVNGGDLHCQPASGADVNMLGGGPITVNNATLSFNAGAVTLTNIMTFNNATVSSGDNNITIPGPVTLSGNSTFKPYQGKTLDLQNTVTGAGGFTFNPATSTTYLNLRGANTYTGPTIVSSGVLSLYNASSLYNADTTQWTPANITVATNAGLWVALNGSANNLTTDQAGLLLSNLSGSITPLFNNGLKAGSSFGILTINPGSDTTFGAVITDSIGAGGGPVGFTKASSSDSYYTLTLSGANTYSGPTTFLSVGGGYHNTLKAGVAWDPVAQSGAFGRNSAVVMPAGFPSTLDLNGYDTQIGSLTGGAYSSPYQGAVLLGANTLTVGGDNTSPAAFGGIIADGSNGTGGNLTKIGTGTLTLTGKNTYTGTTTLSNGVINLGVAEVAGTSGPLGSSPASNPGSLLLAGGTLQYSAANQFDYSGRFSTADNQAYYVDNNNQNVTWATPLTSSGGTLRKAGAGTLLLSGANTYGGATTVNGGTLKAGVASVPGVSGAFGLNSAVTLTNGAGVLLDLNGYDMQLGSLSGGGTLGGNITNSALTPVTLTVGGDNTSPAAFAGVLFGAGNNLVKVGTGTLTLNNTNTYTGSTTITAGTLALGSGGAFPGTSGINLAAGTTLDASLATSPFTLLGNSGSLSASGTGLGAGAALLVAPASLSLNGRPMALTFTPTSAFGDLTHPSLVVTNGNVDLTGVIITLTNNGSAALIGNTYTLITNLSGTFAGAPALANGAVYGNGVSAGRSCSISLSADSKAVMLSVGSAAPVTVALARNAANHGTTSTYGDTLRFDVTVTPATNGTVTLYDGGVGGTVVGSGSLAGSSTVTLTAYLNGLAAGNHANIVAFYGGGTGYATNSSAALTPAQVVGPKTLTVSGAVGNNKLYDGTAAATFSGTLAGVVPGDTSAEVNLIGTGTFNNGGAPGTGLPITASATLGGTKAASYTLTQPTGLTANIFNTAIWTNLTGGYWSAGGNWTNNLVGSGADVTADFTQLNITSSPTVHLDSSLTIGSLTFGDTAPSGQTWTLDNNGQSGNILTLAGITTVPAISAANANLSISVGLTLNTNVVVNANTGVTLSGLITGTGGLTKNGSGTLTLAATTANSYSGSNVINAGTLYVRADLGATPGVPGSENVTVASGATLMSERANFNGTLILNGGTWLENNGFGGSWTGSVILNTNSTLSSTYGGMSVNGVMSGSAGFTKAGNQELDLLGANTFAGPVGINGGTLKIKGSGYLGGGNYAGNITNNGTAFIYSSTAAQILSGAISGPGVLLQTSGQLTLAGTNTYTGLTSITNTGVLELATPGALYNANTTNWTPANLTVASGATLLVDLGGPAGFSDSQAGLLITNLLAVNNGGLLAGSMFGFGGTNTATFSGTLADSTGTGGGAIGLVKVGAGTVTLTGTNTYSGPTQIQAGVLALGDTNALGLGSVDITTGAILQLNYAGTLQIASGLLSIDGVPLADGIYGATGSGATSIDNAHFAGAGTVTVGTPLPPPPTPVLDPSGFTLQGGLPTFTFSTTAGYKYRIVYTDTLSGATWLPVIDDPNYPSPDGWSVVSGGETMTITDPAAAGAPQRFYRIEASAP